MEVKGICSVLIIGRKTDMDMIMIIVFGICPKGLLTWHDKHQTAHARH